MELRLYAPDGREYVPLPKQSDFHSSGAKFRAYVGGFGSGKTLSGVVEAVMLGLEYPGLRMLIGRKSYKELKATTQADFLRVCPAELIESHNKSDGLVRFQNGSEFYFWNLQDPDTFKSLNLGAFFLDEATEIEEEIFQILRGRLRQKVVLNGRQAPRCGYLTTNPNGHDWVWRYFVANQSVSYYRRNYQLIHAPTRENKYLPQDYIEDLKNTYPEEWLARFMEGSFDVFEGQVYPMLDERLHMLAPEYVPRVLEYCQQLPRYRSIDHGYTNPTVCLWYAVDWSGNIFFYREYRKTKALVSQNAAAIATLSDGEDYQRTLIDPSTRNKTGVGDGRSVVEEYREQGIYATPGNNQIRAGILRVSDHLRVRTDKPHPITREMGSPSCFFLPSCAATFEEMRMLAWKKIKPGAARNQQEEPEEKNDHGADCVRYAIMDRPLKPELEAPKGDYDKTLAILRAIEGAREDGDLLMPGIGKHEERGLRAMLPNGYEITLN